MSLKKHQPSVFEAEGFYRQQLKRLENCTQRDEHQAVLVFSFIKNLFPKTIHEACLRCNLRAVKRHLAAGTDVNAKNDDGETPLHMFHGLTGHLRFGYLDIIELLIAEGADVNAKDNEGNTPLHMAAYGGVTGSARILIAAGADVNAENNLGMKPLDAAREWVHVGDRGIIVFLQEHGGNATGRSHLRHHWIEELKAKGN